MDQVQSLTEAASWRQRCYSRMDTLKSKQFPNPASQSLALQEQPFGEKNSVIFELQKVIKHSDDVDRFVDALEQLSSERKLALSAMFDQVTRVGDSLLHEAAYFRRPSIVQLIAHHFPHLLTNTNNKGDTPLHVAATSKRPDVIKALLSQYETHKSASSSENTDEKLTRITNEHGNTPLHDAVRSSHVEGVSLVFEADKCVAHHLNKSGQSPLYWAIQYRLYTIIDILLEAPFSDNKPLPMCHGNSPLHAAISRHNAALINEIVAKKPELMYLRDEDGGTPLHYAAAIGYVEGVRILSNKSALTALEWNAKGHLPIHLACEKGRVTVVKEFLQQEWTHDSRLLVNKKETVLFTAGGRMTDKGRSMNHKRKIVIPHRVEWIKDRVNTLMLVGILIVTVTFAAGFTVPGSVYGSDDPSPHKRGMAVLGKKWMFQVFVLFNTIAMYSSTFGSFLLLWAQLGDFHLALKSFESALLMVGVALVTMTLAFTAAVRLVVSNVPWLANLITIIGIIFLSLILSLSIIEIFPLDYRKPLLRQVSDFLMWFSISLYGSPPKVKAKKHLSFVASQTTRTSNVLLDN
ncbi:protein ACCELERATED CELL DEATH 6-like [Senna tora]|uniref:Protein ACCELERATED CELL DEATH 6-like n=1 Tax=Senna tora TaxID=362788 RepID=A0A835CDS8_9FABA|nr:protein ACCELERATED CELL DEATH 6-like [Senna tora]